MPIFDLNKLIQQLVYDPKNPLLFNQGFFVYFFFLFIALYYIFRNKVVIRKYIFVFFSLYFFYKASGYFVGLVIISAIIDYILSNAIFRQTKKSSKTVLLILSVIFNLGLLFFFKYTNFFIELTNNLSGSNYNLLHLILPIGISFYTFENLSYTLDVYRGEFEPVKKFSDYLLFLSFFPKLVMGPIVRAHDFIPQINKPYQLNDEDFMKGFYLIITGLFKKLIISDYITLNYVNIVFDDPSMHTGLENLVAVYAYAVVIYCDFSGYSDIAIGIARWMGFNIPTNFLSPYQSSNITEFWRRWHISLSSWLKDYLYIPLGGNRQSTFFTFLFSLLFFAGIFLGGHVLFNLNYLVSSIIAGIVLFVFILPAIILKQRKQVGTNLNLLVTMLLGGFWHGANWNFIIWGALHGVGLAVHKVWNLLTGKFMPQTRQRNIFKIINVIITFNFVCFCWIFFKAKNFNDAITVIHQITTNFKSEVWPSFFSNYKSILYMMGLAMGLHFIPDNFADKVISKIGKKMPLIIYLVILFAFIYLYGYFKSAEQVMPIYLQF